MTHHATSLHTDRTVALHQQHQQYPSAIGTGASTKLTQQLISEEPEGILSDKRRTLDHHLQQGIPAPGRQDTERVPYRGEGGREGGRISVSRQLL